MSAFLKFANSPYLTLLTGVVVLVTSGYEVILRIGEGVGARHGVLVLGLVSLIKALPDLVEGVREVEEGLGEDDGDEK